MSYHLQGGRWGPWLADQCCGQTARSLRSQVALKLCNANQLSMLRLTLGFFLLLIQKATFAVYYHWHSQWNSSLVIVFMATWVQTQSAHRLKPQMPPLSWVVSCLGCSTLTLLDTCVTNEASLPNVRWLGETPESLVFVPLIFLDQFPAPNIKQIVKICQDVYPLR